MNLIKREFLHKKIPPKPGQKLKDNVNKRCLKYKLENTTNQMTH